MALHSREDLEEERRLFYVALTRAEKKCTLSYSICRYLYGRPTTSEASRFISEIGEAFLEIEMNESPMHGGRSLNARRPILGAPSPQGQFKPARKVQALNNHLKENAALKVGHIVLHDKFGKGKVLSFDGEGGDKKVKVYFTGTGEKSLLLKFAKLEIVD